MMPMLLNLGITFKRLGMLEDAEASYQRALQIEPDYSNTYYNLSITLEEMGRFEEAENVCRKGLVIEPLSANLHGNLGGILLKLNRPDEAQICYQRALTIKPDYDVALYGLTTLLCGHGKTMMALDLIQQALKIAETAPIKSSFVAIIKRLPSIQSIQYDSEFRVTMVRALTEPWGCPGELSFISIRLLKSDPNINEYIQRVASAWPQRQSAQNLFGLNGPSRLADDLLLCSVLVSTTIPDIEMERFLTMARFAMLETAMGGVMDDALREASLVFYSALAQQCFINEYVYCYSDDEIKKASELRDLIIDSLKNKTHIPALWLIAVAAYLPLHSIPNVTLLLERNWPTALTALLKQQVLEPTEEFNYAATIPHLTNIGDDISQLVQNQYEENPYPRWINSAPPVRQETRVDSYLRNKFPLATVSSSGMPSDILIAGCGTGRHSIMTAQIFPSARILAIDLSIASLCYAKRKTGELGITTIEYAQADLIELGSLNRSFDVIESSGVLHHLSNPFAGWLTLLSVLRPGGFMKLGFYSEIARQHIVKARNFIAERGYNATVKDIRQCRQELMDSNNDADFGVRLFSTDFFSTSSCRDLVFHAQEHRMTLNTIDAFLRENSLVFIGFEIDLHVIDAYKRRFNNDSTATNLSNWATFEQENPDTFKAMYQFWIQKGKGTLATA